MTILTIILVLLLSCVAVIPVIGFIDFMINERKAEIHELASNVVKRTTDRVVKQMIDERDTSKDVEEYDKKRKEMLARMFPTVYDANIEPKKERE